jgi:hypothetical protein
VGVTKGSQPSIKEVMNRFFQVEGTAFVKLFKKNQMIIQRDIKRNDGENVAI